MALINNNLIELFQHLLLIYKPAKGLSNSALQRNKYNLSLIRQSLSVLLCAEDTQLVVAILQAVLESIQQCNYNSNTAQYKGRQQYKQYTFTYPYTYNCQHAQLLLDNSLQTLFLLTIVLSFQVPNQLLKLRLKISSSKR